MAVTRLTLVGHMIRATWRIVCPDSYYEEHSFFSECEVITYLKVCAAVYMIESLIHWLK